MKSKVSKLYLLLLNPKRIENIDRIEEINFLLDIKRTRKREKNKKSNSHGIDIAAKIFCSVRMS